LEVEDPWLPTLAHAHDAMQMNTFMCYNFNHSTLKLINHCRLNLQVLSISGITEANGLKLLQPAIKWQNQLKNKHTKVAKPTATGRSVWKLW
jgi:hypothetical protein